MPRGERSERTQLAEAKAKPVMGRGTGGWGAEQRGPGAPFVLRSLTSGKGQGTVNQRGEGRTGARSSVSGSAAR